MPIKVRIDTDYLDDGPRLDHRTTWFVAVHMLGVYAVARTATDGDRHFMSLHKWAPTSAPPTGLVRPVPVDPKGTKGPTRGQARGPGWRQTSAGLYVPAEVDELRVEQRIFEQASRLRGSGAVTAWASLRWQLATFFDGTSFPEAELLPVPLVLGGNAFLRPDPRATISRAQLPPAHRIRARGVWCTLAERALLDEMVRHGQLRQAVVDVDMAAAAGLVTVSSFQEFVASIGPWTGVPLAREAAVLASDDSRSPQESRMRLVWVLDAELPVPLCNVPVFDLHGNLLGVPDLFDPVAGLVGEYQGADHKEGERHRSDTAREDKFRNAGLEMFEVVGGDLADRWMVVERMLSARARSKFLPAHERKWTLDAPAWWRSRASCRTRRRSG
ncbi:hypothetical protein [Nocardioides sp.]|uniref:hypothetical protein n=1 Tax=Nocardioides sp. TaxID=35761 RepID=UPI002C50E1F4|nr:hypothetical protein [Nocardioides sp.]HXH77565.1 hypothetical protein [Nocardioides sp.]